MMREGRLHFFLLNQISHFFNLVPFFLLFFFSNLFIANAVKCVLGQHPLFSGNHGSLLLVPKLLSKQLWAPGRKTRFYDEVNFLSKFIKHSHLKQKVNLDFSPFLEPPAFVPAGAFHLRQMVLEARQNLSNTGQKYQDNIDPTTGQ